MAVEGDIMGCVQRVVLVRLPTSAWRPPPAIDSSPVWQMYRVQETSQNGTQSAGAGTNQCGMN